MLRYLHARECQPRAVNRRTSAVHLPAAAGRANGAMAATSYLSSQPITLTPTVLAAHPVLRASVLLDVSVCGEFLLAYACIDGDDGGAQVYVLRMFSARSLALCYEFPLFRSHAGGDHGGEQFGAAAAPLAVELVQTRDLLIAHAFVHEPLARSPSDGRDHHLTLIPVRGALARCLPVAHGDTTCSECARCSVCRAHKIGRARHFAFRSYAPHFRLTGGTHTLLPLSEHEHEHRLVFNCGDAVHVATVVVRPARRVGSDSPLPPLPISSMGAAFQPSSWLTESEVRVSAAHLGSICTHPHGRTAHCEFEVCVFDERSCDVERLLQRFLSNDDVTDDNIDDNNDGGGGGGGGDFQDVKRARSSSPSGGDSAEVSLRRQLDALNLRVDDFTFHSISTPDAETATFLLGVVATPRCRAAGEDDDECSDAGAAFALALQRAVAATTTTAAASPRQAQRSNTLGARVHAGAPPLVVLFSGNAPVMQLSSAWPSLLRRAPTVSALRAASTPPCVVLLPLIVRLRLASSMFASSSSPRTSVALSSAAHSYIGAAVDAFYARYNTTALARTHEFATACVQAFTTRALRPLHAALEARVTDTCALNEMRAADNFNVFTGISKPSLQHATLPVRVVAATTAALTAPA